MDANFDDADTNAVPVMEAADGTSFSSSSSSSSSSARVTPSPPAMAATDSASSAPEASGAVAAANLWGVCPFLRESCDGDAVCCTACASVDGEQHQFGDLGSTYAHLRKCHPHEFQRLYELTKRGGMYAGARRRATAKGESKNGATSRQQQNNVHVKPGECVGRGGERSLARTPKRTELFWSIEPWEFF